MFTQWHFTDQLPSIYMYMFRKFCKRFTLNPYKTYKVGN